MLTALVCAVAVSLGAGACVPQPAGPTGGGAPAAVPSGWRAEMLASINAQRAAAGVAPLRSCASLDRAAQAHSSDQAARQQMSHTGSNGSNAGQRMTAAGYTGWQAWAENVAVGYGSVPGVMAGWMGSPGHRANLLSASYVHVGTGLAHSAAGTPYWTQNFGRGGTC
ncbi:MAG: CAP domain-containing protein [Microthrixaceae bacterium]